MVLIISVKHETEKNNNIIPAARAALKANSGLYCFKIITKAVDTIPIPAIVKIEFIIQILILRCQKGCLFHQ